MAAPSANDFKQYPPYCFLGFFCKSIVVVSKFQVQMFLVQMFTSRTTANLPSANGINKEVK